MESIEPIDDIESIDSMAAIDSIESIDSMESIGSMTISPAMFGMEGPHAAAHTPSTTESIKLVRSRAP